MTEELSRNETVFLKRYLSSADALRPSPTGVAAFIPLLVALLGIFFMFNGYIMFRVNPATVSTKWGLILSFGGGLILIFSAILAKITDAMRSEKRMVAKILKKMTPAETE